MSGSAGATPDATGLCLDSLGPFDLVNFIILNQRILSRIKTVRRIGTWAEVCDSGLQVGPMQPGQPDGQTPHA